MEPGMRLKMHTIMTRLCTFSYRGSKSGSHWEKASLLSYQCSPAITWEAPGSSRGCLLCWVNAGWEISQGSLQRGHNVVGLFTCCQPASPPARLLLFCGEADVKWCFSVFHFSVHHKMEICFKTGNCTCKSLWHTLQNRVRKPPSSWNRWSVSRHLQCFVTSAAAGRSDQAWGAFSKGKHNGLF